MENLFLERAVSMAMFVTSITVIARPKLWLEFIESYVDSRPKTYISAVFALIIGSFIILNYNIWEFSYRVIITLVGWDLFITGIILAFSYSKLRYFLKVLDLNAIAIRVLGVIAFIISLILVSSTY